MKIKKIMISLFACCFMLTCLSGCGASSDKIVIGIVQLMEHPALDAAQEGFIEQIREAGYDEDEVEFVVKYAAGEAATCDIIVNQFIDDDVDLILAIATPAAQSAFNNTKNTDIPVVFTAVTDAVEANLVSQNEKPGGNITGVIDAAPLDLQVQLIRDFLPEAKKIGMLYNTAEVNGKLQVDQVKKIAPEFGFEVIAMGVSATTEIPTAMDQLAPQVDCIYNITDNMMVNATAVITSKANENNIPVFAAEDGQMAQGLLASDSLSYLELGKQTGDMAIQILFEDVKAGDIDVTGAKKSQLYVNKKVAEKLGIEIPESVDSRATYLD